MDKCTSRLWTRFRRQKSHSFRKKTASRQKQATKPARSAGCCNSATRGRFQDLGPIRDRIGTEARASIWDSRIAVGRNFRAPLRFARPIRDVTRPGRRASQLRDEPLEAPVREPRRQSRRECVKASSASSRGRASPSSRTRMAASKWASGKAPARPRAPALSRRRGPRRAARMEPPLRRLERRAGAPRCGSGLRP